VQDRELLADATELQLRCERHLGVLLVAAEKAGDLRAPGVQRGKAAGAEDGNARRRSRKSASTRNCRRRPGAPRRLEAEFEADRRRRTRDKIKSGGAILIDPVKAAAKTAEHRQAPRRSRRPHHQRRRIADLGKMAREGRKFGSIGSDPQWKFLTRSAAGEGRSANIHYKTEEVDKIKNLPVGELLADDGAFYMWMVDWCPQDALDLLAHYGLQHITTAFTWVKTNGDGALDIWAISPPGTWGRATGPAPIRKSVLVRHQGQFKDQAEAALCRRPPADRRAGDGALPQARCLARSHRAADARRLPRAAGAPHPAGLGELGR
jgi:hypothetical protein